MGCNVARKAWWAALLTCAALLPQACGQAERASSGGCPQGGIAIAFFGALTGANAQLGINLRNGAQLAVDQYNDRDPACPVELVGFDSQGAPDQAPALATRAVHDERIVALIGPAYSGESKVANPIFDEAGLPLVTIATNEALSRNGWDVFHRIVANDRTQGTAAASYITRTLRPERVAVIDDSSEYGKGIADVVRSRLGPAVIFNDSIDPDAQDYSSTVNGVRAAGPQAIFYGGYYADAGRLLKQLRDAGVMATFVSDDAANDPGLIETAGQPAAEGALVTCPCAPIAQARGGQAFQAAYAHAFGGGPGTYAAEGYDAANVLLEAIAAGSVDRRSINAFLDTVDHQGITKRIAFDDHGEVADQQIFLYRVEGGQIVPVGPAQ
ncbi:MAG: branched-chain amino acid ABC transporter substrate-binding protein [Egibacteraceae bacterium]